MDKIKLLPYGISDFKQVRQEGKYYVDKTIFIQRMEYTDNFLFLIRPRRFGKSIFLSMLRYYYDINERDNFDSLFEGLCIADNPTPNQGQFQVIHLDFSRIGGSTEVLEQNFDDYCNIELEGFAQRYARFYNPDFLERMREIKSARMKLNFINTQAKIFGHQLYLIVDEYDNFTNTVLNEEGEAVYHALTHANGFYRDVFKIFKSMFARILMMGVSPVTMDDVTSGYNIASNISTRPEFNLMLGFSEEDVRQMIRYYQSVGQLQGRTEDSLVEEMRPWYDNYCFSKTRFGRDPKMFNCDMVLYFLNCVMQTDEIPEEMIDPNTRTDYNKMRKLIQLDTLDSYRRGVIHEIAEKGYIIARIKNSFPATELTDRENFISLLFYYGMLTIGGTDGADLVLIIPNNNVRLQYYDWLLSEYRSIAHIDLSRLSDAFKAAALKGQWQPMLEEIASAYAATTSVRQLIEGERNLQGFMNAYMTLNPYYLVAPEVELNHGYCDFFLLPDHRYPMVKHSYILELKYLKTDATEAEAGQQWLQAEQQLRQYAQGPRVQQMLRSTQLHLLILQIRGYKLEKLGIVTP